MPFPDGNSKTGRRACKSTVVVSILISGGGETENENKKRTTNAL